MAVRRPHLPNLHQRILDFILNPGSRHEKDRFDEEISIHNLQRKVLGLPAQSEAEFEECMDKNTSSKRKKSRHNNNGVDANPKIMELEISSASDGHGSEDSESTTQHTEQSGHSSNQHDTSLSPIKYCTRCLFCTLISPNTHENISHMSSAHSFFLPSDSTSPAAVEPLLSYLSLLIYTYHECMFCAREKNSVQGVQCHMRDKAHCKLDASLYEDFFSSGENVGTREEEDDEEDKDDDHNATGTEADERREDDEVTQEKTSHNIEGAKRPSLRKPLKQKIKCTPPQAPHARSRTSLPQQQVVLATTSSLQTSTTHDSSLALSPSSSPHLPPLTLEPAPLNGRNSALSLAGLSSAQLVSLASLDKKMRRQQVSAQSRVGHLALRQPIKAIYYKRENPVYQAG